MAYEMGSSRARPAAEIALHEPGLPHVQDPLVREGLTFDRDLSLLPTTANCFARSC